MTKPDRITGYDSGILTEGEIIKIKKRLNNSPNWEEQLDLFNERMPVKGYRVTAEQTEKGLEWLKDLYKTPFGRIRRNNPFTDAEIDALENFKEFRLIEFTDISTEIQSAIRGHGFYVQAYEVIGNNGPAFAYTVGGHNLIRECQTLSPGPFNTDKKLKVRVWQDYDALDAHAKAHGFKTPTPDADPEYTGWIATLGDESHNPKKMIGSLNGKLERCKERGEVVTVGFCQTGNFSVGYTIYKQER